MAESEAIMEKLELSPVQRRWLMEIGMDARMLAQFTTVQQVPAGRAQTPDDAVGPRKLAELFRQAVPGSGVAGEIAASAEIAVPESPAGQSVGEAEGFEALRERTEACQACGLNEVRGRVVFGEGVQQGVRWMFIGEAPGSVDDSMGRPFQGRPGELLRAMLQSAGIQKDAPAYFTNVLKCRPMGNRSPRPEEIAACLPILRQQIRLLKPASLVALGRVAASALLGGDGDLETLRGRVHEYTDEDGRAMPLVVTHHPASLLLHGQLKAEAWRDLNLLVDQTLSPSGA